MKNSLLISLLSTLSRTELRELGLFVRGPLYNQRQDVIDLCDYLTKCLQELKLIPTKQQVFKEVYGDQAFDDHKVRLIMSFLLKLTERYLVQKAFFQEELKVKTTMTSIYRKRNLSKHFDRSLRASKLIQEKTAHKNADYFLESYQIQLEEYLNIAARNRISALNLQTISNELDRAFIALKLRQTCLSISHQTVYKTAYHFGLLSEILNYVEQNALLEIPAISTYYYCYKMLIDPRQESHFQSFKKYVIQDGALFPLDEIRDLFLLAINFCTKQYNEGNPSYLEESFELYQEGLDKNIFLQQGILSRFTYRNIVTHGLIMKAYDWLEEFIFQYKKYLELPYRESMFSFCLARLEYSRKNYDKVLQLLQRSEYKDLLLNLSAKTVLLKVFYELEEFELLESHLEAMKTFLRRKEIIGYHRENYRNLIRFTYRLLENSSDIDQVNRLRIEIETTNFLAERSWLLKHLR